MSESAAIQKLQATITNQRNEIRNIKRSKAPVVRQVSEHLPPGKVHDYAMSILDPEHHPVHRYPDDFSEPTSIFKSMNNFVVPAQPTAVTGFSAGEYSAIVRPRLKNVITYADPAGTVRAVYGRLDPDEPIVDSAGIPAQCSRPGFVVAGFDTTWYPVLDISCLYGTPQPPIYFENLPYYISSSAGTLSFRVDLIAASWTSGTGSLVVEQVDSLGAVLATVTVNYIASDRFLTGDLVLADTDTSTPGFMSWGLTVRLNKATGTQRSMLFGTDTDSEFVLQMTSGVTSWTSLDIPDFDTAELNVERFRVVSQSSLLTYMSNLLTVGGQAATLLYRGGDDYSKKGLLKYDELSRVPHSYNGPLRDGTYCYWEPMDSLDMSFRTPNGEPLTRSPETLISGVLDDVTDAARALRLRVVSGIEFTSSSQLFQSESSFCDQALLEAVAKLLANVPNAMENGKHLRKLKKIAQGLFKGATAAAKFGWRHRHAIEKIANEIKPVLEELGMLLI